MGGEWPTLSYVTRTQRQLIDDINALGGAMVAADKAREWTDRRNALIVQAREDGATLRQIAELTGLSHTAVAKILAR